MKYKPRTHRLVTPVPALAEFLLNLIISIGEDPLNNELLIARIIIPDPAPIMASLN